MENFTLASKKIVQNEQKLDKDNKENEIPNNGNNIDKKLRNIPKRKNIKLIEIKERNAKRDDIPKKGTSPNRYFGKNLLNNSPLHKNALTSDEILKEKSKSSKKEKKYSLFETEKLQENNPQYLIEYSKETLNNMCETEEINLPQYEKFFVKKLTISERCRRTLLVWLINVHYRFELLPETLYLTINLIDRLIVLNEIPIENFQLLGVSSMLIASKVEEIYAPELRDFIYVTGRTFTKKAILDMENRILSSLHFDILIVSPFKFLQRFCFVSPIFDEFTFYLSMMFTEIFFLSFNYLKYKPSLLATSMLYIANKIQKKKAYSSWLEKLKLFSGYNENEMKVCSKEFALLFKKISSTRSQDIIFEKYSSEKYKRVGKIFSNHNHI